MKPTVFLVLVLGLIGCSNYSSYKQALDACYKWESDEKIIIYKESNKSWAPEFKKYSRNCEVEEETRQVLGLMNKTIERGEWENDSNEGRYEVVKNFRY